MEKPSKRYWPPEMNPENSPVYSYNELKIDAPPKTVWNFLICAKKWPNWYRNSKNVRYLNEKGEALKKGTAFNWTTFGVGVRTEVQDFIPPRILSWKGTGLGGRGFHIWIIEPTDHGCKVITEEAEKGLLPGIFRHLFSRALHRQHQRWLEGLKEISEKATKSRRD